MRPKRRPGGEGSPERSGEMNPATLQRKIAKANQTPAAWRSFRELLMKQTSKMDNHYPLKKPPFLFDGATLSWVAGVPVGPTFRENQDRSAPHIFHKPPRQALAPTDCWLGNRLWYIRNNRIDRIDDCYGTMVKGWFRYRNDDATRLTHGLFMDDSMAISCLISVIIWWGSDCGTVGYAIIMMSLGMIMVITGWMIDPQKHKATILVNGLHHPLIVYLGAGLLNCPLRLLNNGLPMVNCSYERRSERSWHPRCFFLPPRAHLQRMHP